MPPPNTRITFDGNSIVFGYAPSLLRGFQMVDSVTQITRGGKHLTISHDSFREYEVEIPAINRDAEDGTWAKLSYFVSWALRGNTFRFLVENGDNFRGTANGAISGGATSIVVTVTGGTLPAVEGDDWIYLEDNDDPTIFEFLKVASVDDPTKTITLDADTPVLADYVDGSDISHEINLATCVVLNQGRPILTERPGGQGANLWDLRFTMRTVR